MRKFFAVYALLMLGFVGIAHPADVTVSKPGGGGTYNTVQAGIDAAGAGGTVTILDSETYVEDVVIVSPNHDGVTVQAASGQRPTIEAANTSNRYSAIGIQDPADHFGIAAMAPCTFIGINIKNPSPDVNVHSTFGPLTASAIFINSPGVVLRDCQIIGPGASPPDGDWVACLLVSLTSTPASATLENCEVYDADYGVVPSTFQIAFPGLPDAEVTLQNCYIHDTYACGFQSDAGDSTLIHCTISNNEGTGVEAGGGTMRLISCDIVDNGDEGLNIDWDSTFNAGRTNYPEVIATDCLIVRNGSGEPNVRIGEYSLTIEYSIISQGDQGGVFMRSDDPGDAILNMDFCDIFAPGGTCVDFEGAGAMHAVAAITNSILVGDNGVMCNPSHQASVSYCDVFVTGTAFQDTATSNNVSIEPIYVLPYGGKRNGFLYYNDNLAVGEGGAEIGSQGRYIPSKPLSARAWNLYN